MFKVRTAGSRSWTLLGHSQGPEGPWAEAVDWLPQPRVLRQWTDPRRLQSSPVLSCAPTYASRWSQCSGEQGAGVAHGANVRPFGTSSFSVVPRGLQIEVPIMPIVGNSSLLEGRLASALPPSVSRWTPPAGGGALMECPACSGIGPRGEAGYLLAEFSRPRSSRTPLTTEGWRSAQGTGCRLESPPAAGLLRGTNAFGGVARGCVKAPVDGASMSPRTRRAWTGCSTPGSSSSSVTAALARSPSQVSTTGARARHGHRASKYRCRVMSRLHTPRGDLKSPLSVAFPRAFPCASLACVREQRSRGGVPRAVRSAIGLRSCTASPAAR